MTDRAFTRYLGHELWIGQHDVIVYRPDGRRCARLASVPRARLYIRRLRWLQRLEQTS